MDYLVIFTMTLAMVASPGPTEPTCTPALAADAGVAAPAGAAGPVASGPLPAVPHLTTPGGPAAGGLGLPDAAGGDAP